MCNLISCYLLPFFRDLVPNNFISLLIDENNNKIIDKVRDFQFNCHKK